MTVYLAAALFSMHERRANRASAQALEAALPGVRVILPQDYKVHGKFNDRRAFGEVYRACVKGITSSQALVAILDGPDADSGTSFEVGFAVAQGIPVVGVRTDYRPSQESGMNLMLSRGCTRILWRPCFDENIEALARDLARILRKVLPSQVKVKA
jgi:nucleoside 2-deoxyribosyltransferase